MMIKNNWKKTTWANYVKSLVGSSLVYISLEFLVNAQVYAFNIEDFSLTVTPTSVEVGESATATVNFTV